MAQRDDPIRDFFVGLFCSVLSGALGAWFICVTTMNIFGAIIKNRDFWGSLEATAMLFITLGLGFVLGLVTAGTYFYWLWGTKTPGVGIVPAGCGLLLLSVTLSFTNPPYGHDGFLAFLPATVWSGILVLVGVAMGFYRPKVEEKPGIGPSKAGDEGEAGF